MGSMCMHVHVQIHRRQHKAAQQLCKLWINIKQSCPYLYSVMLMNAAAENEVTKL